jgi:ATP-dependent RNA helicase DeaD
MKTFADIGINTKILKGLTSLGFEVPTPIQEKVIPLMLEKPVDLISLAQTGTGKTAAFGVPLIQLTDSKNRQTQGLVLCPTRELCLQVTKDLETFSRHVEGIRVLAVYGGASIDQQIRALNRGVQIIIATPGRLVDLINRGKVNISKVSYIVFDEADEMLQMGFQDEINSILAKTPSEKNTLLFSATMSNGIRSIASNYMKDPVEITVGKRNVGAENVTHDYYIIHARNRYLALKRIVDNSPDIYSIIFCRTRRDTQEIANKLIQDGYNADALHGDLSQAQRDQVMKKFRCRNIQILVATDVAARGLDVNDLTHVINYNLPDDTDSYTHRSGRTGRAGKNGISIAIIHMKERYRIKEIEKKIKKKFNQCKIPSGMEICKKQLVSLVDGVTKVEVDHEQIDPLYQTIAEQLESLDREELIKRFVSLEFNRFLEYYKNAPDLNINKIDKKQHGKRKQQRGDFKEKQYGSMKFTRFFLNVGRRDGIMPQGIIGKINDVPGVGRIKIGKIDIMRNSTLLEADSKYATQIIGAFQHMNINNKTVSIEIARDKSTTRPGGSRSRRGRHNQKNKR